MNVTIYREEIPHDSWFELCKELHLDDGYECVNLDVSEVRFKYGEEPEEYYLATLYKEDFTEIGWAEICKDLEIDKDHEYVEIVVTEITIIN